MEATKESAASGPPQYKRISTRQRLAARKEKVDSTCQEFENQPIERDIARNSISKLQSRFRINPTGTSGRRGSYGKQLKGEKTDDKLAGPWIQTEDIEPLLQKARSCVRNEETPSEDRVIAEMIKCDKEQEAASSAPIARAITMKSDALGAAVPDELGKVPVEDDSTTSDIPGDDWSGSETYDRLREELLKGVECVRVSSDGKKYIRTLRLTQELLFLTSVTPRVTKQLSLSVIREISLGSESVQFRNLIELFPSELPDVQQCVVLWTGDDNPISLMFQDPEIRNAFVVVLRLFCQNLDTRK